MALLNLINLPQMRLVLRTTLLWTVISWGMIHSLTGVAQISPDSIPVIKLRSELFQRVMTDYIQQEKASVIAVLLERYDNDYTYTLYDFGLFDQVKRNPTDTYGKWQGTTLLFYTGLEDILVPYDTVKVNLLLRYLRPVLPDQLGKSQPTSDPNITMEEVVIFDPSIWRFKVRDGKLLWLRRRLAYQSERVPYIK